MKHGGVSQDDGVRIGLYRAANGVYHARNGSC